MTTEINGVDNMAGRDPRRMSREIDECYRQGEEIKRVLTKVREQAVQANKPRQGDEYGIV